ncbi:hypothetical protein C8R44DRAFT_729084 [Mycena epipterygia]|nr:hypothetical protein C8R44DRAFT_729084 [Mycena epipterygia]
MRARFLPSDWRTACKINTAASSAFFQARRVSGSQPRSTSICSSSGGLAIHPLPVAPASETAPKILMRRERPVIRLHPRRVIIVVQTHRTRTPPPHPAHFRGTRVVSCARERPRAGAGRPVSTHRTPIPSPSGATPGPARGEGGVCGGPVPVDLVIFEVDGSERASLQISEFRF